MRFILNTTPIMIDFTYDTFKISLSVITEMLKDRGYILNFKLTAKQYESAIKGKIESVATRKTKKGNTTVLVIWISHTVTDEMKLTAQTMTDFRKRITENSHSKVIIVTDVQITPRARRMSEVEHTLFEIISFQTTQYNPTKHVLVPKHRALTKKEKQTLLDTYNITVEKLPRILHTDPICRWYGFKLRTVIEITRQTSRGPEISYKLVISG